jgi:signal transduction histidine kinase
MDKEHRTQAPPRTRILIQQVSWFNRLRFGAVAGMSLVTTVAWGSGLLEDPLPIYILAAMTLALNLLYVWRFGYLHTVAYRGVRRHANLQIALDMLILTAVLHFSGGCTNPFAFFFLFHAFIAAQMVSVRAGLTVAVTSLVLVGALGIMELSATLPPARGLRMLDLREHGPIALYSWLLALGLTLVISIYILSTVLRQVRTRDEELRRLNLQLGQSEKLASVGTLAAGVAHEINNPVGVIRNKTEILRYRIGDGDAPEALLGELDTIQKHTARIGAITKGLLTFSKESPFELRPLNLNRLAREAADLVESPYHERRVNLQMRTTQWPLWVLGSENHLLQVLVNILLNARDASEPKSNVLVTVSGEEGLATLRIQDSGCGIAEEHLAKIFDPFFTTKDVDRGTGLGLAISHGIVERHQGTITVHSRVGEGTVFQVDLPIQD